ncbi:MAG TPA: hypothetical protein VHE35_08160 [Kofleriaceae bacterium]|nr:hypothetical protein [Kofleriaceae bacterium]
MSILRGAAPAAVLGALLLASACAAPPPAGPTARWQPFAAGATAADVVGALAVGGDPPGGVLVTGTTPWGDVFGLAHLRGLAPTGADLVIGWAGSFALAPASSTLPPALTAIHPPAIVAISIDRGKRAHAASWLDAVAQVRRLDGTAAAPLDLAATLDDARHRWDAFSAEAGDTLDFALEAAGRDTPGVPLGPEQTLSSDIFLPTWSGDRLTVVYARHVERASVQIIAGHEGCSKYDRWPPGSTPSPPSPAPAPSPAPSPAPAPSPQPEPQAQPPTPCAPVLVPPTELRRAYAADLALVVDYDARGALLGERRFPAHAAPGPVASPAPLSRD